MNATALTPTGAESPFISRSELGRRLNTPASRMNKLRLEPDLLVSGRIGLFKISRLPEIQKMLTTPQIHI